jgi:hypothetical protein
MKIVMAHLSLREGYRGTAVNTVICITLHNAGFSFQRRSTSRPQRSIGLVGRSVIIPMA